MKDRVKGGKETLKREGRWEEREGERDGGGGGRT